MATDTEIEGLLDQVEDEDDVDLDNFDGELEDEPEPPKKKSTISEPIHDKDDELETARRERDEAKAERDRIAAEREADAVNADKEHRTGVQNNINTWNGEFNSLQSELVRLNTEFEIAKAEQDSDKMRKISDEYNQKSARQNQLKNAIESGHAILKQAPVEPKKKDPATERQEPTETAKMASRWVKENSWYNDPKFAAKREIADTAYREAVKKGYDPTSLKVWEFVSSEVEKAATTPRRTAPAVRPISSNGAQGKMTTRKSADPAVLKEALNLLKLRNIDVTKKDDPEVKRLVKSYYKTVERDFAERKAPTNA